MCSDSGDIAVRKFPGFVDMFAHTDFPGRQAGSGGDKKRRKEGEVSEEVSEEEEEEERGRGKRKEAMRRYPGRSCGGIREDRAEASGKAAQRHSGRPCRGIREGPAEGCAQRRPQHEASERRPEPQSGRFFRKFILPFRILGLSLCALGTIRALFGV